MEQVFAFVMVVAIVLAAVFVFKNLKFIRNYKTEYLIEFHGIGPIEQQQLHRISGIYDIHQISTTKFRAQFNESKDTLQERLNQTFSSDSHHIHVSQLHSWLKTNAWKK